MHKEHLVPVRKMTNGELKEYLNTFPDDAVSACEADEEEAEQLAGQMDISDFPEVMP